MTMLNRAAYLREILGIRKSCRRCIVRGVAKEKRRTTRPQDRTQAHWARLATGVDGASVEAETLERGACPAYRNYLGVRSRVVIAGDAVLTFSHQLAFADNDRSKRTRAQLYICCRQGDGAAHPSDILFLLLYEFDERRFQVQFLLRRPSTALLRIDAATNQTGEDQLDESDYGMEHFLPGLQ